MRQINHVVGGETRISTGRSAPIFNPATGEEIATVGFADVALIDEVVALARSAATAWGNATLAQRT